MSFWNKEDRLDREFKSIIEKSEIKEQNNILIKENNNLKKEINELKEKIDDLEISLKYFYIMKKDIKYYENIFENALLKYFNENKKDSDKLEV